MVSALAAQTPPDASDPQKQHATAAPRGKLPKAAGGPSPVPSGGTDLSGWIDFGYRWRTGVNGSLDTYRSIINLGSGPKLLGADFTLIDPKQRLFDTIHVRASGWGGEPYGTLHVEAKKSKLYRFNADYRDLAYFNYPAFLRRPVCYARHRAGRAILRYAAEDRGAIRWTSCPAIGSFPTWLGSRFELRDGSDWRLSANAQRIPGADYAARPDESVSRRRALRAAAISTSRSKKAARPSRAIRACIRARVRRIPAISTRRFSARRWI